MAKKLFILRSASWVWTWAASEPRRVRFSDMKRVFNAFYWNLFGVSRTADGFCTGKTHLPAIRTPSPGVPNLGRQVWREFSPVWTVWSAGWRWSSCGKPADSTRCSAASCWAWWCWPCCSTGGSDDEEWGWRITWASICLTKVLHLFNPWSLILWAHLSHLCAATSTSWWWSGLSWPGLSPSTAPCDLILCSPTSCSQSSRETK